MTQVLGQITSIIHKPFLVPNLSQFEFSQNLNFNLLPSVFILNTKRNKYAACKWVSPKRTRSYPFARVYNTLSYNKKISIIALVKDEGKIGERDFLQFDTVSLLSLLDVYLIVAYYADAKKASGKDKITSQQFDNQYLINKITELEAFQSSALHWNLQQLNWQNLANICTQTVNSYLNISNKTGVILHNLQGIELFKNKISHSVDVFKEFSRIKAKQAQHREYQTIQPKEQLSTLTKAKITLNNYLGGLYFLTVDEISLAKNYAFLIESKHSARQILPSENDIKDALLKIILYANLKTVQINHHTFDVKAILRLTSNAIVGAINSNCSSTQMSQFFTKNKLKPNICQLLNKLFIGAKNNNFLVQIEPVPLKTLINNYD